LKLKPQQVIQIIKRLGL